MHSWPFTAPHHPARGDPAIRRRAGGLSKLAKKGIIVGVIFGACGLSGWALAKAPPVNIGGQLMISAYAKREVLKVGMETTIIVHAAGGRPGRVELYDKNTGTYRPGNALAEGADGFVVSSATAALVTYVPVVQYAGILKRVAGPPISVEWQSEANATSNGFSAPNGGEVNASFYTTGAESRRPAESVRIAPSAMAANGYNSEGYAQDFGGAVLLNWTDLSSGATDHSVDHWTVPSDGKPMKYQMTAYAVQKTHGWYNYAEQAKAYSPTYVANEPANPHHVPEIAKLGSNLKLTGMYPEQEIWFSYIGMNTPYLKWQAVVINLQGTAVIPLNRLGTVKILLHSRPAYVNVESPGAMAP